MAQYERHMSQYDGPDLKRQDPFLLPGEKWIIAQFHDESCFHTNEFKQSAWSDQTVLQKKSRGRLIHVSDFINEEDGHLVQCNSEGDIVRDAQVVIHPGAAGDPYWDMKQLLAQVEVAISIFDASHPDCQALFIFNQSSAHASLGPDALCAFDMNKANGGKQRIQKDTVIPGNAPNPAVQGQVQKMTTGTGVAKGLQQVLEERSFNTSGIRTKCVPYWGYAKYCYRKIFKMTFADAKAAAQSCLDACPLDTIWHFINRAWHFMSAYRMGLTGKATEWAVKKQKSHRRVSQRAMLSIETLMN
ncbi:hypothetical protein BS47DRAFT_1374130 [Hydnum rufescens UP504]|uniref:Uncharacterized protein n=1 Tax=Hydnum rufescens UP504 TaxID=1448309 RepID=A0A9P6DPJ1_9AGAM|nr:hypothetical protein BS47DRAFT_1374130 [Hydnum rufescens UP504]